MLRGSGYVAESLKELGYSFKEMVNSVELAWTVASDSNKEEGAQWYPKAQNDAFSIADVGGWSVRQAAVVLAHLSPQTTWKRNVEGAYALAATGEAPQCLSGNVERAKLSLQTDEPVLTLKGRKTRSFALNILGDHFHVTIDVWMLRLILGDRPDLTDLIRRVGVYASLSDVVSTAAEEVGVTPATMQATTWIWKRNGRSA